MMATRSARERPSPPPGQAKEGDVPHGGITRSFAGAPMAERDQSRAYDIGVRVVGATCRGRGLARARWAQTLDQRGSAARSAWVRQ
jgi:hypothetical protein